MRLYSPRAVYAMAGLGALTEDDLEAYGAGRAQAFENIMEAVTILRESDVTESSATEAIMTASYQVREELDAMHMGVTQGSITNPNELRADIRVLVGQSEDLRSRAQDVAARDSAAFSSKMLWAILLAGGAAVLAGTAITLRAD